MSDWLQSVNKYNLLIDDRQDKEFFMFGQSSHHSQRDQEDANSLIDDKYIDSESDILIDDIVDYPYKFSNSKAISKQDSDKTLVTNKRELKEKNKLANISDQEINQSKDKIKQRKMNNRIAAQK